MTYSILDWKIHNTSRELKWSNTTLQAEFWIVLTQVRSYVFSIQDSVSHRIVNPVWIYNRTDHLFHTTISSHYVLDNTIWLLLLYSHIGLVILIWKLFLMSGYRKYINGIWFWHRNPNFGLKKLWKAKKGHKGQWRPMKANEGQWRPAKAKKVQNTKNL